jgi:hypothetical protein
MTTIFLGGVVVISALGKWAREVTEVLILLLAASTVMLAIVSACGTWPNYCAHLYTPPALAETPFDNAPRDNL